MTTNRFPVVYLPHGGGPWPWMDPARSFGGPGAMDGLRRYLTALPKLTGLGQVGTSPKAILMISAHWEAVVPTVSTSERPPMLYDYSGFPPETYQISWPAPGSPALAAKVRALLDTAGLPSAQDAARGFDHGTFVPLAVAWPDASVPTVQLSLVSGLDPALHLRIGAALYPLREEGVLIVGSGMSYHNMRGFGSPQGASDSQIFDAWLRGAVTAAPAARQAALTSWAAAPSARACHPREEHLLPLMVSAGAARDDLGQVVFSEPVLGTRVSAVHFG